MKTRIGIIGYGNLGRGAELAVSAAPDMELAAVFTRRAPGSVATLTGAPALHIDKAEEFIGKIDVMLLCGGSASDLPGQGPKFAAMFNTVDSFDTHAKIPGYFAEVDAAAKNTVSIISAGWDPGLFSLMKLLMGTVLPSGDTYSFWGRGVSQGHSEAIRGIKGVKRDAEGKGLAVQYTVPDEGAMATARAGGKIEADAHKTHLRECWVVAEEGADKSAIEREIITMPNYFAGYRTVVHFISEEELRREHSGMPHAGAVIRSGSTGANKHTLEFSLKLDSNPEFTASVVVACARAAARLHKEGARGARTMLDFPLSYLSPLGREGLLKAYM